MGISNSAQTATESDSDLSEKNGTQPNSAAPTINSFFPFFKAPKNERLNLDSSDTDITLEDLNIKREISSNLQTKKNKFHNPEITIGYSLEKPNSALNFDKKSGSKESSKNKINNINNITSAVKNNNSADNHNHSADKINNSADKIRNKANTSLEQENSTLLLLINEDTSNQDSVLLIESNNNLPSAEVMRGYQRYSREPPEKDQNLTDCPVPHNMKSCCRSCCVPLQQKQIDSCHKNSCPRYKQQVKINNNRQVSDSFVVRRNSGNTETKPSQSKSAPLNVQQQSNPKTKRIPSEPKNIPQPPPPPKKQGSPIRVSKKSSPDHLERKLSPEEVEIVDTSKQMYNPHNYNYKKQHYKTYPYEEPTDSTSYSHDTSCERNCTGYEHCPQHRICKCQCMCDSDYYLQRSSSDDQISCCSDSTKTDFMNLAYQRTGDYPELVDELENTLSQRNRLRVQKTMQRFEMLSRQNKNLEKPIFDDDESHHGKHRNKCSCCKSSCRSRTKYSSESRSDSLTKRPSFQPAPVPRSSGYVEKVARHMDPNLNEKTGTAQKYPKSPPQHNSRNNSSGTNSGNGSWQMDARKGEWVKVNQGQYDFENNYPPLPPRPRSSHMFEEPHAPFGNRHEYQERNRHEDHSCSCNKCMRHNNR